MTQIPDIQRLDAIQTDYDRETNYYTKWAETAHLRYMALNISSIVFGAAVPIVALIPGLWGGSAKAAWVIALAGIFGAISTLCRSVDGFQKNKEEWMDASHLLGFEERDCCSRHDPGSMPILVRISSQCTLQPLKG